MTLGPHDHHLEFNDAGNSLVVYNAAHQAVLSCEARNRTVGGDGFGHEGRCPLGTFKLGSPRPKGTPPFGPWFVPILELPGHHEMDHHHRAGIGIHGGGSGLPDPFAPHQGWVVTEGCIRVQNADLRVLVAIVQDTLSLGGTCYLTVS